MNDIDWDALDRYFNGEASPREAATVERADTKLLKSVREIWDAAGVVSAPASPDVDEAWRSLSDRMTRDDATVLRLHRASSRSAITWHSPRIWPGFLAACAAVAIAAVALNHVIDSREAARRAAAPPPAPREFSTRSAQRAEVMLSDGTRVVLAPESKLTVPAQYDSLDRAVSLEGQAYFDVARDNGKPFTVRARHALVRDLGTRFDVRAFANEASVRVVVTQGKVTLRNSASPDAAPLLNAGDVARLRETGAASIARGLDTTRFVAWTSGELVFERTPIREALAELARWYDIDVQLADSSLDGRRLTATLKNQTLSEVLALVGLSLNVQVERRDRTVTIRANN